MKSWGSIILGAAGLGILDAVVSRSSATKNVGGAFVGISKIVNWFVSPTVAAFSSASVSSGSSTSLTADQRPATSSTVPALSPAGTVNSPNGAQATTDGLPVLTF
jgi:hypothetical protein